MVFHDVLSTELLMLLVAFWCSLWLLFGLSWAAFWPASLWPLRLPCGLSRSSLGPSLGHFGTFLGLSWRLLCLSWAVLGLLVLLVAFCASLGSVFQAPLDLSWALFWTLLVLSWCDFGFMWTCLALQRALSRSWVSQASSRVFSDLALHL